MQGTRPSVASIAVHFSQGVRLASAFLLSLLVLVTPARALAGSPSPDPAPRPQASAVSGSGASPTPDPAPHGGTAVPPHPSQPPTLVSPSVTPVPSGGSEAAAPVRRATPAAHPTIKPKLAPPPKHSVRAAVRRRVEHRTAAHHRSKRQLQRLLASAEAATVASRDHAGLLLLMGAIAMGVAAVVSLRLRRVLAQLNAMNCDPPST
ncbi:MAG: hypothetical protein ACXVFQ_20100 [Solirubrobacteraceae bacterium]